MKTCDDLVNTLFPFRCWDRPGPDVEARIIQPARDPSSDQPKFILATHQGAVARRVANISSPAHVARPGQQERCDVGRTSEQSPRRPTVATTWLKSTGFLM